MMELSSEILVLKKKIPITISRGTHSGSSNLFVQITEEGYSGIGEMCPGTKDGDPDAETSQKIITQFWESIDQSLPIKNIWQLGRDQNVPAYALAALDIALWDLKGKKEGKSIRQLLNIPNPKVATSVTLGIMPPTEVAKKIPLLLDHHPFKSLKVKLGSPEGIAFDKAMFEQVVRSCEGRNLLFRVDANGGWDVEGTNQMIPWLAERGVDYIEQPLAKGDEANLKNIFENRVLPIYVDESCQFAEDIDSYYQFVDGINMKLMKCGGITGALEILDKCKEYNLKTMIGCMGESSVSISAAAQISGAIDYIDLDSHFNIEPDPGIGALPVDGVLVPNDLPGHGARFKENLF